MANPFLSLDGAGFIDQPGLKVDAILATYAATQYSQSVLYLDIISSLTKDIQLASQQWERLPELMNASLNRLFSAYFDQVEIDVSLDENSMNAETTSFKVYITGSVTQDGVMYDIAKLLQVDNAKFSEVSDFTPENIKYSEE